MAAILALLIAFAVRSESPLFKSGNKPDGVNENNEVQCGIACTGCAVTQKGLTLSALHFLFDKQHEQENNWSRTAEPNGWGGGVSTEQPILGADRGSEIRADVWALGQQRTSPNGVQVRTAGIQTAAPAVEPQQPAQPTKLTYANHAKPIEGASQSDQAPVPSAAGADCKTGFQTGLLRAEVSASASPAGFIDRTGIGSGLVPGTQGWPKLRGCQSGHSFPAQARAMAWLTPPPSVSSVPDGPLATIGRPASQNAAISPCSAMQHGIVFSRKKNSHSGSITEGKRV